ISITNFVSGQDQWYLSNGQLTDNFGRAQNYPASKAGNYKVIRTNQDKCKTVSDSVILKINNNPVLKLSQSKSIVCKNVTVNYSVSDENILAGSIFKWFINGNLVQNGTGKTFSIDTLSKNSLVKVSVLSTGTCLKSTLLADSVTTLIKRPFTIGTEISPPSCYKKNGSIYLFPSNGYTILGGTLKSFSNNLLGEGNYTVSVRENSSFCVVDTSFTLTDFSKFDYTKTIVQPDCGGSNGSLTISPIASYGFSGDTIKSVFTQNLDARKYTFLITLGNCTKKNSVILLGKASFKVNASIVQPTCSNAGSINLFTNPPVGFTVSKTLNKASNPGLGVGKYDITITDNQTRCGIDTSFILSNPNAVNIKLLKADSVICSGNPIKPKYLNLPDTSELTFNWFKNGKAVSQKSNPALKDSGIYVLNVKNLDGCSTKDSLKLISFTANAGRDTSICIDNGQISLKAVLKDNLAKGSWKSQGFASVNTPQSMKTTVSNLLPYDSLKGKDANRFVWSVTKAGCTETDTAKIYYAKAVITVTDVDTVLAGIDIEIKVTNNDRYSLGDKLKVKHDTIRPSSPFRSIEIL
ncbi:MAG: hypothetical protein H7329_12910, partial [Opitutaceae bacterium]|nr:hypothetical protein [Cytophagales bacterium]